MTGQVIATEAELAAYLAQKNGKPMPAPAKEAHAKHAPSSADQRRACPGSRRMQELYPETEESQASREGTAAHWAVLQLLTDWQIDSGLVAPNGVMLDDEMCEAADVCAEVVMRDYVGHADAVVMFERTVSMPTIHEDCYGTPDYAVYLPSKRRLIITDFKYGHRFVSEFENWQLIEYFEGVFNGLGLTGIDDQSLYVTLRIVQPRCYVGGAIVREWTIPALDLRNYVNEARMFEEVAARPDAPCRVGPQCHDCTARHACPAQQQAAASAMDVSRAPEPFNLPPSALGVELRYLDRALDILKARRDGLAEQALYQIKHGQPVPFYQAKQGFGRKRWSRSNDEVLLVGDMMGVNLRKVTPLTPNQAEKAGLDAALIAEYSEVPPGEIKLEANDGTSARRIFGIDATVNNG